MCPDLSTKKGARSITVRENAVFCSSGNPTSFSRLAADRDKYERNNSHRSWGS